MSKTETKETKEVKPVAPKGTKTTEVILGTAASKLGSGLKFMAEMMTEIGKLEVKVEENVLLIADQEAKIAENNLALKNQIAQNKIELQQAYNSDREAFVEQWMIENNCAAITKDELQKLKNDLETVQKEKEAEIKKEVAIVTNTLTRNFNSEKREYELQFVAKEAQNTAALAQKDEKIKFLEQQVELAWNALKEEREARVKVAQASTIQQTITSGK
jgi:hypothetical protein